MSPQALIAEILLVLAAMLLAVTAPHLGSTWFRPAEQWLERLARRPLLSILAVSMLPLAVRAALFPFFPIPEPVLHDEFSYLLAGDTFAHLRLTNPSHPMWVHFETFHVNQQPTYMSMYPPAQGTALAAGEFLFGHPWLGACLSVGVMAGAILWMLQGWLPPGWALFGAALAALRVGVTSYWMNSYAGGAVAAIGGALLFGALARLRRKPDVRHALLLGLGVAILANSRPYEGLVLCLPVAAALVAWRILRPRVLVPLVLVLGVTATAMGYYFWRVTGSPFRMPYQVNRDTYSVTSVFLWRAPRPAPVYHHAVMREFYLNWELPQHLAARRPGNWPSMFLGKLEVLDEFYLGPALTLPLLMFPFVLRDRRVRFLLLALGVFLAGLAMLVWTGPHYAAPATAVLYALVVQCARHLRLLRWRRRLPEGPGTNHRGLAANRKRGLFFVRALPLVCLFTLALCAVFPVWPNAWCCTGRVVFRSPFINWLNQQPGEHLVLVRYKPGHSLLREWVYNEADIDRSRIVWAREMDEAGNRRLLHYFKDRRAWLLEPDDIPLKLSEYR